MSTRRDFFRTCACAAAAGTLGAIIAGCSDNKSDSVTGPPPSGNFDVDLAAFPALAAEQSAVTVTGTPAGTIFVTHTTGETYFALSRVCTHQGCMVNLPAAGASSILPCPCHGSRFHLDGTVSQGPASRALTSYPVSKSGNTLTIQFG